MDPQGGQGDATGPRPPQIAGLRSPAQRTRVSLHPRPHGALPTAESTGQTGREEATAPPTARGRGRLCRGASLRVGSPLRGASASQMGTLAACALSRGAPASRGREPPLGCHISTARFLLRRSHGSGSGGPGRRASAGRPVFPDAGGGGDGGPQVGDAVCPAGAGPQHREERGPAGESPSPARPWHHLDGKAQLRRHPRNQTRGGKPVAPRAESPRAGGALASGEARGIRGRRVRLRRDL